jgi:hypothetical protein
VAARKILLAAVLFLLGWLTMQTTRCDARGGDLPANPASPHAP